MQYYRSIKDNSLYYSNDGLTLFEVSYDICDYGAPVYYGFLCNCPDMRKISKNRVEEILKFFNDL